MRSTLLHSLMAAAVALAFSIASPPAQAQSHYDDFATMPFEDGYIAKANDPKLLEELFFERAVQTYLWALPALNMYGMKEGSEKVFGKGYNVLPIFKQRAQCQDADHDAELGRHLRAGLSRLERRRSNGHRSATGYAGYSR
ncbi:hypothetical protein LJR231_001776 [Phyllobacterium sp. LjRoot231]|uniref:hypothetical protein n=1 Tax=Phyllobacterium sp. LjRoot231 TaxID=3342289 RepID=UPI003ECCE1E2